MFRRNLFRVPFPAFLLFFCFGQALAQIQELAEFKDVKIPFRLKYEDLVMEKGTYDFVFLRNLPNAFLLKIKKQGKTLTLISGGEKINYPGQGDFMTLQNNPEIPKLAKMGLKKDPEQKVVYLVFETGKQTKACPFHKIRFRFDFLE